jgi:transcriptional regulator with XRE-family HTH domain
MYPNLKLQMWRSGIRQNRLARTLQIDETTLSRIVNGFRQPCAETKAKIAAALNCDLEWLFEQTPDPDQLGKQTLSDPASVSRVSDEPPRHR